ncbi:hypothetical protein EDB19DRAFT_1646277, partial [Suillus lakei]
VLKYPEDFALNPNVSLERAANMLFHAIQISQNLPYTWTLIDNPQEVQIYLLFMLNPAQPLNDGIRWQDRYRACPTWCTGARFPSIKPL